MLTSSQQSQRNKLLAHFTSLLNNYKDIQKQRTNTFERLKAKSAKLRPSQEFYLGKAQMAQLQKQIHQNLNRLKQMRKKSQNDNASILKNHQNSLKILKSQLTQLILQKNLFSKVYKNEGQRASQEGNEFALTMKKQIQSIQKQNKILALRIVQSQKQDIKIHSASINESRKQKDLLQILEQTKDTQTPTAGQIDLIRQECAKTQNKAKQLCAQKQRQMAQNQNLKQQLLQNIKQCLLRINDKNIEERVSKLKASAVRLAGNPALAQKPITPQLGGRKRIVTRLGREAPNFVKKIKNYHDVSVG